MGVNAAWLGNVEVALLAVGFRGFNLLLIMPTYDSLVWLAAFAIRAVPLSVLQEARPWRLADAQLEYGDYHD